MEQNTALSRVREQWHKLEEVKPTDPMYRLTPEHEGWGWLVAQAAAAGEVGLSYLWNYLERCPTGRLSDKALLPFSEPEEENAPAAIQVTGPVWDYGMVWAVPCVVTFRRHRLRFEVQGATPWCAWQRARAFLQGSLDSGALTLEHEDVRWPEWCRHLLTQGTAAGGSHLVPHVVKWFLAAAGAPPELGWLPRQSSYTWELLARWIIEVSKQTGMWHASTLRPGRGNPLPYLELGHYQQSQGSLVLRFHYPRNREELTAVTVCWSLMRLIVPGVSMPGLLGLTPVTHLWTHLCRYASCGRDPYPCTHGPG